MRTLVAWLAVSSVFLVACSDNGGGSATGGTGGGAGTGGTAGDGGVAGTDGGEGPGCTEVAAGGSGALITNGTFDDGTTGWFAFGGGTLAASTAFSCAGSAGAVTGRTETYHGPGQSLIGKVESGDMVGLSAWVRIQGADSATVNMTLKTTAAGADTYAQVASATVPSNRWVKLSGSAGVSWTSDLTELSVYFEGPPAGVDIYVDNVYGLKRGPVGGSGTGNPDGGATVTISPAEEHQTLAGFGASAAWYGEALIAHPSKAEIYPLLFQQLGLDILRFRNRYQRTGESSALTAEKEIFQAAQTSLGRTPALLLTSWSPPAAIKANSDDDCSAAHSTAKTCTLRKVNGAYDYEGFADYWAASLAEYAAQGLVPDYVSIQNEPDFSPSGWEGCVFDPSETATYPGYDVALRTVHQRLSAQADPPMLIGPETLGIHYGKVPRYLDAMDTSLIGAVAHHLYEQGNDGIWDWKEPGPDSYVDEMFGVALAAGGKPRFQTEFQTDDDAGNTGGFETAWLIHNSMAEEDASAFLYWDLFWATTSGIDHGLVSLDGTSYRIRDQYYSLKHYAYYTDPGYVRVGAESNLASVRVSAYTSPADSRLVIVLLNVGTTDARVQIDAGTFTATTSTVVSSVYAGTRSMWNDLGALPADRTLSMAPRSVATVVLER